MDKATLDELQISKRELLEVKNDLVNLSTQYRVLEQNDNQASFIRCT